MRPRNNQRASASRICATVLLGVLFASPVLAKDANIERWVDGPLSRHVITALKEHPRFRDATVRFVVMAGGQPTAAASTLELRLRDRLRLHVAGRVDNVVTPSTRELSATRDTICPREAQYLVGLELESLSTGLVRANVRAFDTVERSYVPSIALHWQGRLLQQQRLEHRTPNIRPDVSRRSRCALRRLRNGPNGGNPWTGVEMRTNAQRQRRLRYPHTGQQHRLGTVEGANRTCRKPLERR